MEITQQAVPGQAMACQSDTDQASLPQSKSTHEDNSAIYVFLYKNGDILFRSKLSYLGILGMQVNADPLLFPKHARVDAVIYLDTEYGPCQCKINAVVTSRSVQCVGFTFINCDVDTFKKLKKLIHYMGDNRNQLKAPPILSYASIPD